MLAFLVVGSVLAAAVGVGHVVSANSPDLDPTPEKNKYNQIKQDPLDNPIVKNVIKAFFML